MVRTRGFTFVELLLVLVIVALLASLAAPVLSGSIQRAREATLRESLAVMRRAIDDYYADAGRYPPDLETLVASRYLRAVPPDPITGRVDWRLIAAEPDEEADASEASGIIDVRSASPEPALDGSPYAEW